MDADQIYAYNACVYGDKSVFCTGGAGSGKSFVLSNIVKRLKERYKKSPGSVAVTASTGSAAFLIGGMTLHKFAGIGIEEKDLTLMIGRAKGEKTIKNWEMVEILLIDEISMLSGTLLDNLSLVAQNIKGSNEPFGGIRLLVFGDFLQLPPISNSKHEPAKWAFNSDLWKSLNMKTIELKGTNRQKEDMAFAGVLKRLRHGLSTESDFEHIRNLGREVKYNDSIEPVRLYAKRNKVSRYNLYRLSQLETESVVLDSIDKGNKSLLLQCPVEKSIELKVGSQVMLVRNIDKKLVNGSVGTLVRFETNPSKSIVPVINMVSSNNETIEYKAEPVDWTVENSECSVVAIRTQVPLILAWSITIHKSQGRTIPRLIVDMDGVFEEGQCYVALSRCPCDSNIQVLNFKEEHVMTSRECVEFYRSISDVDNATHVALDTK